MHSDVTSIRSVAHAGRPQRSLGKHKRKPLKSTSCGLIQQIPEMFEWFWCGLQTQKGRDVIETVGVHSIAWISVSLRSLTALGDATWRRNMNLSWCVRRGWVLSINMYRHVSTVFSFASCLFLAFGSGDGGIGERRWGGRPWKKHRIRRVFCG